MDFNAVKTWFYETVPVVQTTLLTWSLVAFQWVSAKLEDASVFAVKTVHGALDAHKTTSWVFADRNSIPWSVKDGHLNYPLVYFPAEMLFSGGGTQRGKFDNVVMAELRNSDKTLIFDMSAFFHQLSWFGSAPSLYEVALTFCLTENLVYSKEALGAFTLEATTTDGVKTISLASAKEPFSGWASPAEAEAT